MELIRRLLQNITIQSSNVSPESQPTTLAQPRTLNELLDTADSLGLKGSFINVSLSGDPPVGFIRYRQSAGERRLDVCYRLVTPTHKYCVSESYVDGVPDGSEEAMETVSERYREFLWNRLDLINSRGYQPSVHTYVKVWLERRGMWIVRG